MKIISIERGQTLQLFNSDEIWPLTGLYVPDLVRDTIERYQFTNGPENSNPELTKGIKFHNGHMKIDELDIFISELQVFNDGILVSCTGTTFSDLIADDIAAWATARFKLRTPTTHQLRRHVSHIVFEFDAGISKAMNAFVNVADILSGAFNDAYQQRQRYDLTRLGFAVDPQTMPPHVNTAFVFERRINVPYTNNRFFSTAPLSTLAHHAALERIEASLSI
jgi:hypothetical protein